MTDAPLWVTSNKTHIEHNEFVFTLIADVPAKWICAAMGQQRIRKKTNWRALTSQRAAGSALRAVLTGEERFEA